MSKSDLETKIAIVLIRGGGDLASGVAVRLWRAGIKVVITELVQPLAVRRLVSFSEAVYEGQITIEGVTGRCVPQPLEALRVISGGEIPVLVDPEGDIRFAAQFEVVALVDARMRKRPPDLGPEAAPLVIGLGPGFVAGENCHAVVETNRGHDMGRVLWKGAPEADTGVPGKVGDHQHDRVLRAPADGNLRALIEIGSRVTQGSLIASVAGEPILAPFDGVLRGLLRDGMPVKRGMKTGDLDPRDDPRFAVTVSEKSLAIGGGVLEALLTHPEIRVKLWS